MEPRRPRLTKPLRAVLIMLWMIFPSVSGSENQFFRFPGGTEVELVAPVLEPGQVMLARLLQAPDVRKLTVRFGDATYELGPREQSLESFALIGLDLGLKPGPYDLEMTVVLQGGRTEKATHRGLCGRP